MLLKCIGSVWKGYKQKVVPVSAVQAFWRVKVYLLILNMSTRQRGGHVLPTLLPVLLVTIEEEAGYALETVWMIWRREKSLASARNQKVR